MHFSRFIPAAAGLLGLAHGHLSGDLSLDNLIDSKTSPAVFDLGHSWNDHTLFKG